MLSFSFAFRDDALNFPFLLLLYIPVFAFIYKRSSHGLCVSFCFRHLSDSLIIMCVLGQLFLIKQRVQQRCARAQWRVPCVQMADAIGTVAGNLCIQSCSILRLLEHHLADDVSAR